MKNRKGLFLISIGLLLVAAALLLTVHNMREETHAQQTADAAAEEILEVIRVERTEVSGEESSAAPETILPEYVLDPDMAMPETEVDGTAYIGVLEIPACGLTLPVISEWSYAALKEAPCRYMGSVYSDDLILAGHNYRSHFGKLENLKIGDEIRFTDVNGNVFTYAVLDFESLNGAAVEEMEAGDWELTLFTCDYSGRRRFTVRCGRTDK